MYPVEIEDVFERDWMTRKGSEGNRRQENKMQ
jgi:hypothetical protein